MYRKRCFCFGEWLDILFFSYSEAGNEWKTKVPCCFACSPADNCGPKPTKSQFLDGLRNSLENLSGLICHHARQVPLPRIWVRTTRTEVSSAKASTNYFLPSAAPFTCTAALCAHSGSWPMHSMSPLAPSSYSSKFFLRASLQPML